MFFLFNLITPLRTLRQLPEHSNFWWIFIASVTTRKSETWCRFDEGNTQAYVSEISQLLIKAIFFLLGIRYAHFSLRSYFAELWQLQGYMFKCVLCGFGLLDFKVIPFLLLSDQLCWQLPRKTLETSVVTVTFYDVKVSALLCVEENVKHQCSKFNSQVIVERTQPIWKEQYTEGSKPIVFLFPVFKGFLKNLTTGFFSFL